VLARAEHRTLADRTTVSLDQIVIDALASRSDQITERQLMVRTALARIGVAGSEPLLARMVENVIENAVVHNQSHGFIYVACRTSGRESRLVVESGGSVLDEEAVAQLAQPFRRLGTDRTGSQNGQGLGLSIVAAVADAHDGALELHARSQGGLRVQITLPSATPVPATPVPA
jgi:signal transduction histidine kinase